jgi:UPF0288 family protein (methanogenesis marker protein 3)
MNLKKPFKTPFLTPAVAVDQPPEVEVEVVEEERVSSPVLPDEDDVEIDVDVRRSSRPCACRILPYCVPY